MRKIIMLFGFAGFFFTAVSCANNGKAEAKDKVEVTSEKGDVIYLTKESFKTQVFDFEKNKEWKYEGKVPAIVDFYADWCGPCKMLSPVLAELQKDYNGKIQIFKVNTDQENELAATFGIQSLPTIVFIPVDGDPQAVMGFRPKADLEKMITEILKVQK